MTSTSEASTFFDVVFLSTFLKCWGFVQLHHCKCFFGFVQRKSPFYFWDSQQFWDHFFLGSHLGDWKEPLRHGDRIQLGWVWSPKDGRKVKKSVKHLEGGDYKEIW